MLEKIIQAAFYDPTTDKIYPVGDKHNVEFLLKYQLNNTTLHRIIRPENQGFLTDRGRWLGRRVAAILSHTGRLNNEHEMLSSEIPESTSFEINIPLHEHIARIV